MRVDVSKFGKILLSRPAGRDAFLAARAYVIPDSAQGKIELDFRNVIVMTPSWLDEFVSGLKHEFGEGRIHYIPGENASVRLSFEAIAS